MLRTERSLKPPTSVNRNKHRSFLFLTLGEVARIKIRTKPKPVGMRDANRKNKSKSLGTYACGVNSTGRV